MSDILSMDVIKKRHETLYAEVLRVGAVLTKQDTKRNKLIKEIEGLINDIRKIAETVESFEEYRWLSDAVVKWQSVFSTIFGTPKIIILPQPKTRWLPPTPPSVLTEKEIENWLRGYAAFIAYARRAESGRGDSNPLDDWHAAEVFFASEVLEGRVNLASRISSESYERLERIWLEETKRHMAYLKWVEERSLFVDHDKDFFDACNHIRDMLINKDIKASISEFNGAKSFIQKHYLDEDDKLLPIERGHKLREPIERKAFRIYETTGSTDSDKNWVNAEIYVRMFYDNIIPAVVGKKKEKVLRVLKGFQYSTMNRFNIINCFEAALAIYFLDPDIIKQLWDESAEEPFPDSSVESIVELDSWPLHKETTL